MLSSMKPVTDSKVVKNVNPSSAGVVCVTSASVRMCFVHERNGLRTGVKGRGDI